MTAENRTSNLVVELRKWYGLKGAACFREAADEIERLQAEIVQIEKNADANADELARLRAAVEPAAALPQWYTVHGVLTRISENGCIEGPLFDTRPPSTHEVYLKSEVDQILRAPQPPSDVQRDAERWRALIGCARVRVMGYAGLHDPQSSYAHIGVEFWTHHEAQSNPEAIETLLKFVERAALTKPAVRECDPLCPTELCKEWDAVGMCKRPRTSAEKTEHEPRYVCTRNGVEKISDETKAAHVCGLQGFDPMRGDTCPACDAPPIKKGGPDYAARFRK